MDCREVSRAASLEALLRPRSVAIVGASDDPGRIGGRPLRYLIEGGFPGAIHPVNPRRATVQGLPASPDIASLPGPVDCAVLAIAADATLQAVRDCAAKGVRSLVVFTAGFAEMGENGQRLQAEMTAIGRAHGMRIIGPNCLGLYNDHARAYLTFTGIFGDVAGRRGRIGLVSQSGGYASHVVKLAQERQLDFGTWVTTGNEADVELGEVMGYLAEDPETDVIVAYIEGIRRRDTFIAALEAARRRRKPVVVLKVGATQEGANAAASHTASLAGADDVYDAVFRAYGVHRARTTDEMLDVVHAAKAGRFPSGRRLVVVSGSGGVGAQAADYASQCGLDLAAVPPAAQQAIMAMAPNASARNPVDVTGNVINEPGLYGQSVSALLDTGSYDAAYVFIGLAAASPGIAQPMLDGLAAAAARHQALPMAATVLGPPDLIAAYEKAGFLNYRDSFYAIRSLAALAVMARAWDEAVPDAPAAPPMPRLASRGALDEVAAKAVLARVGIATPREEIARTAEEAASIAASLGAARIALKIVSPDLPHKTEVGGVALDLQPAMVAEAARTMASRVAAAAPAARIEGFLVTPMIRGGVEFMIGVHRDPVFGPVIMLGLGGVMVELLKDVTCRLVPVTEPEARRMVTDLRGAALLAGHRGAPPADTDALVQAILAVSRLAEANADHLVTIEINPLRVLPRGEGVLALDAVIETQSDAPANKEAE